MKVGGIYYTTNRLDPVIWGACLKNLKSVFPEENVVSVSLEPMSLGKNFVFGGQPSYPTYLRQIRMALDKSDADYVFFLEHDVLYHPSHFDFVPERDDIYYYNVHNYRWRWDTDVAITYDGLSSLSGLCVNRQTALNHYNYRISVMEEQGLEEDRAREPRWARRFGYEPGTKPTRRGGLTDEEHIKRHSLYPNIDIRHRGTFSKPKTFRHEFHHFPETFREVNVFEIEGWNLKEVFDGFKHIDTK
jgi:hypothetical protein